MTIPAIKKYRLNCVFGLRGIIIFLFSVTYANAQTIEGKVVDAGTGKAVPNASIYLNGTSNGTSSDNEGKFIFHSTGASIPLVVSCLGYESQVINDYARKSILVALKTKVNNLREVTIGFDGMSRADELKIFLTEFIGAINKDCFITNTDAINFIYHKKSKALEADANEPLLISNKKLGYKITYFLSSFKWTSDEVVYRGNYFFTEDTAGVQPKDLKKILKARKEVYLGSRMHFIRTLWGDNLERANFNTRDSGYKIIDYKKLITDHNGQKFITFPGRVEIVFNNETISYLQQQEHNKESVIESNGYYDPGIYWGGQMAAQRINKLLPYEFDPGNDKINKYDELIAGKVIMGGVFKRLIMQYDTFLTYHPVEKLYVQLDKPYYTTGDTLRFKTYLFNADYLTPSTQSGLLYIELDGLDNQPVKKMMVPVSSGLSWGDVALDEKEIPAGTYTLRAYTNWMRNFGEQYVFKQQINISSITSTTFLKTNFNLQGQADKQNVQAALQLTGLDGRIRPLEDVQLKVMDGKKNLSKDKVTTGVDGVVKVNFDIPAKTTTNNLSIKLQQTGKEGELTIPVTINRPENTDLQFMPEGGNMLAGISTKVGFKAIAEDGKGVDINGIIINSKQQQVASFASMHAGMGSFGLIPQAGESYTAQVKLSGGIIKNYPLPIVKTTGTLINIYSKGEDSLIVTMNMVAEKENNSSYYLIGQARGVICYAEHVNFKDVVVRKTVPKNLFPTGIARFTLLNAEHKPLNERIVFIDHHDELHIDINTNKLSYATRDSIALKIQVADKDGKPVHGNFSVAITDDQQVKTDSTASNILNNLLLTSDLKGTVQDPGYYFTGKTTELDNLMLTQGWIGYDWQEVFYPKLAIPEFTAEKEFLVKGTVTNAFGKPIEKSNIVLAGNHPLIFKDTLSDKDGRFVFKGLFPVDTALFRLQARNKHGNDMNVRINADNVKPPVFAPLTHVIPWYVNMDTSLLINIKTRIAELKATSKYEGNGRVLKDVNIKDNKIIPGSKNLNGPGEADQVLGKEELEKAGKMTLGDLLEKKIKNFFVWGQWSPILTRGGGGGSMPYSYVLNRQRIHFIFDGLDLDDVAGNFISINNPSIKNEKEEKYQHYLFIKSYLDYFTAEDITGIEVMENSKYTNNYNDYFSLEYIYRPESFCFIEITTRSKQGPYMKVIPGTYLYKALPFTLPKQFYRPRYTVKNSTLGIGTDLRSTIHWEPNIVTDKYGNAQVSFFSADRSGNYTVIIEGADMNGNIGRQVSEIKITSNPHSQ